METRFQLTPYFPNEISENILVRLSLKNLVRFSCVSKPWHHLIFSREGGNDFAKFHVQNHARELPRRVWLRNYHDPKRAGPSCPSCNKIPDPDGKGLERADLCHNKDRRKSFFKLGNRMCVVNCVDGIFCLIKDCYCDSELKIYLWNPALRQLHLLPRSMDVGMFTLAVGFGYDNVSQDYIVAKHHFWKLSSKKNWATYKFDVYSLKTQSWTTLKSFVEGAPKYVNSSPTDPVEFVHTNTPRLNLACVVLNGYLYSNSKSVRKATDYIDYFHLTRRDDSGYFSVPDYVTIYFGLRLRLYREALSLSGFTRLNEFELWVMIGVNSDHTWVKQFCIPSSVDFRPFNTITDVTAGGMVLGYINGQRDGKKLAVYDPARETVEFVKHKVSKFEDYFVVDNYVESLVSVVPSSYADDKKFDEPKAKSFARVSLFGHFWLTVRKCHRRR